MDNPEFDAQLKLLFDRFLFGTSEVKLINDKIKYEELNDLLIYFVEVKLSEHFKELRDYFLERIKDTIENRLFDYNDYVSLIIRCCYSYLVFDKLRDKYQLRNWETCFDPDYLFSKRRFKRSKRVDSSIRKKIADKQEIGGEVQYIVGTAERLEEFDKETCQESFKHYREFLNLL